MRGSVTGAETRWMNDPPLPSGPTRKPNTSGMLRGAGGILRIETWRPATAPTAHMGHMPVIGIAERRECFVGRPRA
jgi:hypothetical protein